MNRILSTFLLAALAVSAHAGKRLPAGYDYTPVNAYFVKCLETQIDSVYTPVDFESDYTVRLSDAPAVMSRVWDEWVRANNMFASREESIMSDTVRQLPEKIYSLTIPSALEPFVAEPGDPSKYEGPDAKMVYTFGRKGQLREKNPLFIFLHGSGPAFYEFKAAQMIAQRNSDAPSIYFIPRIPNGVGNYFRWYQQSKQWAYEKLLRQAFMRSYIDPDRIYVMGISEGAYGSQRLASFYADYLAGAGPIAGGEPLPNAPAENLRNTYFNFMTGELDTTFGRAELTSYVGNTLDSLHKQHPDGYLHDVTIMPGANHGLSGGVGYYHTAPALAAHKRVTNPKHVSWENYPMDGRHRSGFYNLKVIERSEPQPDNEYQRSFYQMDIDGNDINVEVSVVDITPDKFYYDTTIPLHVNKTYTPATSGRFRIYLGDKLVDLSKDVALTVNGKKLFHGKLKPNLADMVGSCAEYFDPERVYPTSIEVDLSTMTCSKQ